MKDLASLKSIFKDRIFKIPDYQRGYAWTEDQLTDFWEDLVNLNQNKFHYTGVLSIKKVKKATSEGWIQEKWLIEERGYEGFYVVDGQQRLTTFVIFIQSLCDFLKILPENKDKTDEEIYLGSFNLKQIKEEYLVIQKPPQFIINSYKFSYETDNPSFEYLRYNIFKEKSGGKLTETVYTLNLENAKSFFDSNIIQYYNQNKIKGIEELFKKITQNMMFNLYEIGEEFDVFVAFETMNNRGKKLSNLELLKNRLIYLTTLYGNKEIASDEREILRAKINDAWKEVYHQLGRNKNLILPDDEFLNAHWITYFKYKRIKGGEYIRYLLEEKFTPQNILNKIAVDINSLQKIEEVSEEEQDDYEEETNGNGEYIISKLQPKEIEEYVISLKSSVVHWYNTWNPKNNDNLTREESLWLDRLNRLSMGYFRPLVTASFMSKKTTSYQRVELFKEIERFIFIIFRLNRFFSTYRNSEFYGYARQLLNDEISTEYIIKQLHKNLNDWFVTDEETKKQHIESKHFNSYMERLFKSKKGYYGWNGLRYFLYEYEMGLVRERGNQKIDWKLFQKNEKDKVSIEHIFPQNPEDDKWPEFKKYNDSEVNLLQGSLGNLLPLSQSINSSLQNDSFENKKHPKIIDGNKIREGYSNGSHSEIEVSRDYNDWKIESIKERGLKLLNFMEQRWNFKFKNEKDKLSLLFLYNIKGEPDERY